MQLRPYQQEAVKRVYTGLRQYRSVMLQMPCRSGKTPTFCKMIQDAVSRGHKVLVLADRQELIYQAAKTICKMTFLDVGLIKAGEAENWTAPVQVGSRQTLINRLDNYPSDAFGFIVIDEAHHTPCKTYRAILEHFLGAKYLGVTATPVRTNGQGFEDLYSDLVTVIHPHELMEQGFISPFRLYASVRPVKTEGARKSKGDWNLSDIETLNEGEDLAGDVIESYFEHRPNDKATNLVFAYSVDHSKEIAERYQSSGINAVHLDCTTPKEERKDLMEQLAAKEIQVVSNFGLFAEGVDIPGLDMTQILRPTQSLSVWIQMCFRPLTPDPGKQYGVIIDHTDSHKPDRHGLPDKVRVWNLEGKPKEPVVAEEQLEPLNKKPKPQDEEGLQEKYYFEDTSKKLHLVTAQNYWAGWWSEVVARQQHFGYKKWWIFHRCKKAHPPLEIWEALAKYLGYKPGWGWHQFNEHNPEAQLQKKVI